MYLRMTLIFLPQSPMDWHYIRRPPLPALRSLLRSSEPPEWSRVATQPPKATGLHPTPAGRVGRGGRMRGFRRLFPGDPEAGAWTRVFAGWRERARGGGACAGQERARRACAAEAAVRAELGDGGSCGGAESVSAAREPPARAQCDPDPARPPAHHGQRGQPGGRRGRRAAAARRLWSGSGPRSREAAFSTSRRWTAPRGWRCASSGTPDPWYRAGPRPWLRPWPGQVRARFWAPGGQGAVVRIWGRGLESHDLVDSRAGSGLPALRILPDWRELGGRGRGP